MKVYTFDVLNYNFILYSHILAASTLYSFLLPVHKLTITSL